MRKDYNGTLFLQWHCNTDSTRSWLNTHANVLWLLEELLPSFLDIKACYAEYIIFISSCEITTWYRNTDNTATLKISTSSPVHHVMWNQPHWTPYLMLTCSPVLHFVLSLNTFSSVFTVLSIEAHNNMGMKNLHLLDVLFMCGPLFFVYRSARRPKSCFWRWPVQPACRPARTSWTPSL